MSKDAWLESYRARNPPKDVNLAEDIGSLIGCLIILAIYLIVPVVILAACIKILFL